MKGMHDTLVEVYGIDCLDESNEFVLLPAVVRGKKIGHLGLALIELDLQSSGEHWDTHFLTPMGILQQSGESLTPPQKQYVSDKYIPYEYWLPCRFQMTFISWTNPLTVWKNFCLPVRRNNQR